MYTYTHTHTLFFKSLICVDCSAQMEGFADILTNLTVTIMIYAHGYVCLHDRHVDVCIALVHMYVPIYYPDHDFF